MENINIMSFTHIFKENFIANRRPKMSTQFFNIIYSRFAIIFLLMILFLIPVLLFPSCVSASDPSEPGTVYLLVVDKFSINDINEEDTPCIIEIINHGSVGLASTRTLKGHNTLNTYLTIGAGNLARTNKTGLMAFNRDEIVPGQMQNAAQSYQNITGFDPEDSACLLTNLPDVLSGMTAASVTTIPGAIGQVLTENGYKTCVLGNADTGSGLMRPVVGIGMDAAGKVPLGDVGTSTRVAAVDSILTYKTDYDYLQEQTLNYEEQADLIIFDLADLARLENADAAFDNIIQAERSRILGEIDLFAGWINQKIDPARDLILIISPSAPRYDMADKNNFTPVIARGCEINHGYLTSPATHRDYILANTDIAPTILNFFSLKETAGTIIGRPIQSIKAENVNTLKNAVELSSRTSTTNRLRSPLIKAYVVILIIVILCAAFLILKFRKQIRILPPLIIAMICFPLVLLPLGKLSLNYDWQYILVAILATIILTAISLFFCRGNGFKTFVMLSIITVIALDIDILTGTSLIQCSVLGYDPMSGARYYGIGNEYMGILIGASIAAAAAVYERFKSTPVLLLLAAFFLFQCYLIGSPSLGANSDGIITAPFAYLITLYLFSEMKLSPLGLISIASIILMGIIGVSYYDMNRPAELQTHIGRAANQIFNGGWQEALTIIIRKLQVNIKLIKYTIWSRVFLAILSVLAVFIYFPVGAMKNLLSRRPIILKGFAGIVTAALVGLIVNDSGIVAASTTSIYLVMPLLLMMSLQKK